MSPKEELISLIVLNRIPGIGPVSAKTLIRHFGSAYQTIHANKSAFLESRVGNEKHFNYLNDNKKKLIENAHSEWNFCERYQIKILSFYQNEYPLRLKQLIDAPLILYFKGSADLNPPRTLAIIGTRKPKPESLELTHQITQELASLNVQIISGLAYGIDISAHRSALKNQLSTLGVLAHGLDTIYPSNHRNTAHEMILQQSGLLTEMQHKTKLHPDLFPRRNRIIAGLSDAVLVIESKNTGGSMSTAQIARSYDREVFAVPGSPFFGYNTGTNALIKRNVAHLIESADDIIHWMKWQSFNSNDMEITSDSADPDCPNFSENSNFTNAQNLKTNQKSLFENINPIEAEILNLLANQAKHIDELLILSQIPLHQLTLSLLELELKGLIKTMPGKYFSRA